VLVAAIIVGLGAAAATRMVSGGASGGDVRSGGSSGAPGAGVRGSTPPAPASAAGGVDSGLVQPHKPLTPAELDKLRLRELNQLSDYTKRQANRRLTPSQRNEAGRGIADLQRAADKRLQAELRREQSLRDQLARSRAKAKAPPPPPRPGSPPTTNAAPTPRAQRPSSDRRTAPSKAPSKQQQTCLLDQDTGQYICPQ
jgi:hypothetical protein